MKKHIEFTNLAIKAPQFPASLRDAGASVEFEGIVREMEKGKPIQGLFYEAYEAMAKTVLEKMMDELGAKHVCQEIWLIHRLGAVPVGEPSIYLRVLAQHRQQAFEMAAQLLTRMKQDAPIWKTALPASLSSAP
jgi:molybdopterin synthase catalytic subunit